MQASHLWKTLESFTSLQYITLSSSDISLPEDSPSLPSVKLLEAEDLCSYLNLMDLYNFLPELDELEFIVSEADAHVAAILPGILRVGSKLTGLSMSMVHYSDVRDFKEDNTITPETMSNLYLLIQSLTNLETIMLCNFFIEEGCLVKLVEACRKINTMTKIW